MKYSALWLHEWVKPSISQEVLCHKLTMSGLEVEDCTNSTAVCQTSGEMIQDQVLDLAITPNRGDCLSIRGLAREIAALTETPLSAIAIPAVIPTHQQVLPIRIMANQACPRYVGRIIRHVKADKATPLWLQEKLACSGIKSISPIVDVTNYVLLELGQPMHAFDLAQINQGIDVRFAKVGETITLLDDSEQVLDEDTLVIADHRSPLAIAGVMGGLSSSVTLSTQSIFLESAYFSSQVVTRQRQHYHVQSDSAYRFERGVDFTIQREAMERATQLIIDICGGEPGPLVEMVEESSLPTMTKITLTAQKVADVLGFSIPDTEIQSIFDRLQLEFCRENEAWEIIPPVYRYDLRLPEDIIEEIARIHGYENIPTQAINTTLQTHQPLDLEKDWHIYRQVLSDGGYHEIISYSFIEQQLQNLLDPNHLPHALLNPISADMSVMRTSLWPGLINTLRYNQSRQQQRVRLFELGTCFVGEAMSHEYHLAGLLAGAAVPEQWGASNQSVDFYDLKGDVEGLLSLTKKDIIFQQDSHPALHPGQTASIGFTSTHGGFQQMGIMGALHPAVLQQLDLQGPVYLFEIKLDLIKIAKTVSIQEVSKFPEIRRDLAILVKQTIPAERIQDTIRQVVGDWLKESFIFDVYQGKGILPDQKSVAMGLILQHPERTLVDDEVFEKMEAVVTALKNQLGAELRS